MQEERKASVYFPQVTNKRDGSGNWIPTIDIRPAEEHGNINIIFPSNAPFYATADMLNIIKDSLKSYNFEAGDAIVAVGDPSLIAATVGWLAANKGKLWLLKWDRTMQRYHKIKFNFNN